MDNQTKICSKCYVEKDLTYFSKNGKYLRTYCSECRNKSKKEWYEKNKIDQIEKSKLYNKAHPEINRQARKTYYIKNKSTIIEKAVRNTLEKRRTDPVEKLKHNLRNRLRQALKNKYKSGSAVRDLGCSIEELKLHLESKFKEGMSWDNYGKWHIDHIRPLSSFDLKDLEQFKQACHYSNLQPLWAEENLRKSDKYDSQERRI